MMPILKACSYAPRLMADLLLDDNSEAVRRLRLTATSNRLFKKYQWNEVRSGFSALF